MLKYFTYKFSDGPLSSVEELSGDWDTGNCRRAVQYYIWNQRALFLSPDKILCPSGYNETGTFVINRDRKFIFDLLADGDVIYAEKIRDKEGKTIDKSEKTFASNDAYVISLHTALFSGNKGEEIWHATAIEGSSCYWSLEQFLHHYRPIAAKRV